MLDFSNSNLSIQKEDILNNISEYDIFKRYCDNFEEIDKPFCSTLRIDNKPDVRIYISNNNQLRYKDFASGDNLDCFNYVMKKYNCTYYEAINIIANDFKIGDNKVNISPNLLIGKKEEHLKETIKKSKSIINIISQPFNIHDFKYWNQYNIDFETLESFDVFSTKKVILYKGSKRYIFDYSSSNPIYSYRFTHDGKYSYKCYWPLSTNKQNKWLFSGDINENIEGYDQLPLHGDLLIITKSLKDVICYYKLGYNAISLQGEANKLNSLLVAKLERRFKRILINYDEDKQGIIGANRIKNQYGFKYYFIDEHKDLSDYIKINGIKKAKEMIKNKVHE